MRNLVEVVIGFNLDTDEIAYIKSDFMDNKTEYKDPIGYTAMLMEMALTKWIREKIGVFCPQCDKELNEDWVFCPNCGWNPDQIGPPKEE